AYDQALRAYGLDLAGSGDVAAPVDRPEAVRVELAAVLDDWAILGRALGQPEAAVARRGGPGGRGGPDADRDTMRRAWLGHDLGAMRRLTAPGRSTRQSPASLGLLATILAGGGDRSAAVGVLRRGLIDHPHDVWLNYDLARELEVQ